MTHQTSNRMPFLKDTVIALNADLQEFQAALAEKVLAMGTALNEAKETCPHGEWTEFLKSVAMSERSAQRYMRIAKAGLKSATVADLGLNRAEACAGYMLKFWPDVGQARFLAGHDEFRFFWLLVLRVRENLAFFATVRGKWQFGDDDQVYFNWANQRHCQRKNIYLPKRKFGI
jgi:hypothetical protein